MTISGTNYIVIDDLAAEPVDKDFFKEHARIDFDTDDDLVEKYITAARKYLESYCQLSFGVKKINLLANCLPKYYKMMFGPVDTITTADFTNKGDLLVQGGYDIDIEFNTKDTLFNDEVVQIAICRYAAGLYINRENVIDSKLSGIALKDQALEMLQPYRNIIIF